MPPEAPGEPAQSLRSLVVRGLGWKAFSQLSIQALALPTTIVIAHLITPADLGLVAMTVVFSSLALLLADLALGAALVQRPSLTEEDRSTAFWLSAAIGILFTVAGVALAGPIASLYGEPKVKPLFEVISITFLLSALGTTQGALLIREFKFRSLEIRTVIATVAASAVTITLALFHYGPWAIVGQKLTMTGVSTVLLWLASGWRPRLLVSRASLRDLLGFSGYLVGTRFLFYLNGNADNYIVGRYVGTAALGAYSIAYNVMLVPLTRLVEPIQQVFYPALSRIADPERIGTVWLRTTTMVAAITVPAFAGMMVVAPDFVPVVLGGRWHESVRVLQILSWVGLLQTVSWQAASVLQALDRTSWLFRFGVVSTALTVSAFAVGVHWGVVGVASGYAIVTTVLVLYWLSVPMRLTGVGAMRFVGALSGVVQAATVMTLVLVALRLGALQSLSSTPRLFVLIAAGTLVYLPLCAWRAPVVVGELRALRQRGRLGETADA